MTFVSKMCLVLVSFVCLICTSYAQTAISRAPEKDRIEQQTGLMKVEGDRFIIDLKYNSSDNFLKKNVYEEFGLFACYVHPKVYKRLMEAASLAKSKQRKIVLFDCFRPLSVQKAMWKIMPDSRYVANPKSGSLHNRGIAIDVGLATEDGVYLEFPTVFDSFEPKAWASYQCPDNEKKRCQNRNWLSYLMQDVGLFAINSEWWHFQLQDAKSYPLIDLKP